MANRLGVSDAVDNRVYRFRGDPRRGLRLSHDRAGRGLRSSRERALVAGNPDWCVLAANAALHLAMGGGRKAMGVTTDYVPISPCPAVP